MGVYYFDFRFLQATPLSVIDSCQGIYSVPMHAVLTQRRFAASSPPVSFRLPRDRGFAIVLLSEASPGFAGTIMVPVGY